MKFTSLIASTLYLLSFLSFPASAAPWSEASPSRRSATIPAGETTCVGQNDILFSDYRLFLDTSQLKGAFGLTASDCGNGFKDNLHGQCGLGVTQWHCDVKDGGLAVAFRIPETCSTKKVQNSIWLATSPHMEGVTCSDAINPNILKVVLEVLEELAKVILSWAKWGGWKREIVDFSYRSGKSSRCV